MQTLLAPLKCYTVVFYCSPLQCMSESAHYVVSILSQQKAEVVAQNQPDLSNPL